MILTSINIIDVPHEFTPKQLKPYPVDNEVPFEEWFYKNYQPERNTSDRVYLPIQWTAYYCNNRHGRDRRSMKALQLYLDHRLDRGKKYFTIVQYDDRILNNVSHLDLKVFGMGCKGDVQLPLVCKPHKYEFKETGRPIFASFIGSITHPIREQMVKELQGKEGYFISIEPTSLHSYCYIMSQSKFVLCPRGYGKTSFRIQEAMQFGATPVYLSDDFLIPDGFLGVLFAKDIKDAVDLMEVSDFLHSSNYESALFFDQFTYEAVANRIYENL